MKNALYFISLLFIGVFAACQSSDDPMPTDDSSTTDDTVDPTDDGTAANFLAEIDWTLTYGGSGLDVANSVVETADGGYAIVGYTQSTDGDITDKTATDSDFWVFKLASDGSLVWSKTFGGTADDRGTDIVENSAGFAVTGFSRSNDGDASNNEGFQDFWVLQLSASGNLLWERSFGFAGSDQANALITTNDGGFFVTGFLDVTASEGEGNDGAPKSANTTTTAKSSQRHGVGEFWGLRLDANGDLLWRRFFGGSNNDRSYDARQTNDGGFLMIGSSESEDFDISNPNGSYDFWAVRLSGKGDFLWEKSFGGSQIDIAYNMTQFQNGNVVLVGDSRSTDGHVSNPLGNADFWAVEMRPDGSMVWEQSFGGTLFDSARAVDHFNDNSIVIAGTSRSSDLDVSTSYGQNDGWIMGASSSGILWEVTSGGTLIDVINDVVVTTDQKVIAVGDTESNDGNVPTNKGAQDALIVKIK